MNDFKTCGATDFNKDRKFVDISMCHVILLRNKKGQNSGFTREMTST